MPQLQCELYRTDIHVLNNETISHILTLMFFVLVLIQTPGQILSDRLFSQSNYSPLVIDTAWALALGINYVCIFLNFNGAQCVCFFKTELKYYKTIVSFKVTSLYTFQICRQLITITKDYSW